MKNRNEILCTVVVVCATMAFTGCSSKQSAPGSQASDQTAGQSLFVGGDIFDESQQGPISVLQIHPVTGQLAEINGSPFSELSNISDLLPAQGKFLFFTKSQFVPQGNTPPPTNQDTSGLYRVALESGGELGSPVFLGRLTAVMDPSGSFLFVQDPSLLRIDVQRIDSETGNLIPQGNGLRFSQQVGSLGTAGNRIWIDPSINNVGGQLAFQPVDINPETGALTVVPVQLTLTIGTQETADMSYGEHSVVIRRAAQGGAATLTVYSEDGSSFRRVQTCTLSDSEVCGSKPTFSKKGDLAFFIANGKLWSVPFDSTTGFHLNSAKTVRVTDNLTEVVTNSDDSLVYALNPTTGHIEGFQVDSAGNLAAAAGSDVTIRMPPGGSFAAFSVGATSK